MLAHSEFRLLFRDTPNESIHHWTSRSFRLSVQPFYPGPYLQMAADHTNNATHLLWTSSFNGFPVQIRSRTYFIQWWQKLRWPPNTKRIQTHQHTGKKKIFELRCLFFLVGALLWVNIHEELRRFHQRAPSQVVQLFWLMSIVNAVSLNINALGKEKKQKLIFSFFFSALGSERAFQHVLKTFCHICSLSFLCFAWLSSSTLLFSFRPRFSASL